MRGTSSIRNGLIIVIHAFISGALAYDLVVHQAIATRMKGDTLQ